MTARTSETHPIRVDFIADDRFPELRNLGMTFAPGKKQRDAMTGAWDRDLDTDLRRLKERYQIDTLVALLTDTELDQLGIRDLVDRCVGHGIGVIRHPIKDFSVPDSKEDYFKLIARIASRMEDGGRVLVHCKGGLGRAGMTAACAAVAVSSGMIGGEGAIRLVRSARKGAVETAEQEKFIRDYASERGFEKFSFKRPTARDAQELLSIGSRLTAPDFKPTRGWLGGEADSDGVISMPYPDYDPIVPEFFGRAQSEPWADYEYTESTAPRLIKREGFIESACVDDIKTLLTWSARVERFCDGHWESVIEDGTLARILDRIHALNEEGRFPEESETDARE